MSKSGFTFQPKPEGNHYVTIHLAYKLITDGKASTAGLLSVFEYLAESTLSRSSVWMPGDQIPRVIEINGTCTNALLMKLLDGLIKESSLKAKIKVLEKLGYISVRIVSGRYRHVSYNYAAITEALSNPDLLGGSKIDGSKIDGSKIADKGSKIDGLRGQKMPATIPLTIPSLPKKKESAEISFSSSDSKPKRQEVSVVEQTELAIAPVESGTRQNLQPVDAVLTQKRESAAAQYKSTEIVTVGTVTYKQAPESIDLAEDWELKPHIVKTQVAQLAPGHKQPGLVANSLGMLWVGPRRNDWDSDLIDTAIKYKSRINQGELRGDAITYLNNLAKNNDWSNLEQRWTETQDLKVAKAQAVERAAQQLEIAPSPSIQPPAPAVQPAVKAELFNLAKEKGFKTFNTVLTKCPGCTAAIAQDLTADDCAVLRRWLKSYPPADAPAGVVETGQLFNPEYEELKTEVFNLQERVRGDRDDYTGSFDGPERVSALNFAQMKHYKDHLNRLVELAA